MTAEDANKLLDSVKDGAQHTHEVVNSALSVTGDLLNYVFVATTELDDFIQALLEGGAI
jgi:hypothetical protein